MNTEECNTQDILYNTSFPFSYQELIVNRENLPIDFLFLSVNKAFEEEMGLKASSITNSKASVHSPWLIEDDLLEIFGQVVDQGSDYSFEKYFKELDRWMYIHVFSLKRGQFATLFTPMTKYTKDISNLPDSLGYIKSIVENISEFVIYYDLHLSIQWVNTVAASSISKRPEDLIGKKCYEVWYQRTSPCEGCPILKVIETGKKSTGLIQTPDSRWWRISGTPIENHHGDLIGVVEITQEMTQRIHLERELKERQVENQALLTAIPDEMVLFDKEGQVLEYHRGESGHLFTVSQLVGKNISSLLPPPLSDLMKKKILEVLLEGQCQIFHYSLEISFKRHVFESRLVPFGEGRALAIIRNITREKRAEEELQKKTQEMEMLLDNIEIQVYYLIDEKTYGRVNLAHQKFLNLYEDLEYQKISEILPPSEALISIQNNRLAFEEKKTIYREEWLTAVNGEKRLLAITRTPKLDSEGEVEYVICSAEDITERREVMARIQYLSFHDSLTGLYNRYYMDEEIKRLNTTRQLPLSIIMCDLNGLKLINDTLGHHKGDELIKRGARVIKETCRVDDIVGRYGGDEFVIILPKTGRIELKKIMERLKKNSESDSFSIPLSIAFGGATRKKLSQSIDSIWKEAEDQMYRNKLLDSRVARSRIVSFLLQVLAKKSCETEEHAWRMLKMAFELGEKIGLSNIELERLSLIISLHDIGKISISESILQKTEILTEKEWEIVKTHSEMGYRIAISSEDFSHIAEEILAHHEWWNGRGYPRGLRGEEIPLLSRITTIIDAYDVMVHGRAYREGISKEEALLELKRYAGSQFDPELVEQLTILLVE